MNSVQHNVKLDTFAEPGGRESLWELSLPAPDVVLVAGGHVPSEIELGDKLFGRGDDLVVDVRDGPLGVSPGVGGIEPVGAVGVCLGPAAVPQRVRWESVVNLHIGQVYIFCS